MDQIAKNNLYRLAITKWGKISQLDMLVEESAELIKAVNKFKRFSSQQNCLNLLEEIADVEIMCEQVRIIFNNNDVIEGFKNEKLHRLANLLKS